MMQCGQDPAGTFKTMAEVSNVFKRTSKSEDTENTTPVYSGDNGIKRCSLSFSSERDISTLEEPNVTCKVSTLQSVPDNPNSCRPSAEIAEQLSPQGVNTCLKAQNATELKDASVEYQSNSKQHSVNNTEDKENSATPSTTITPGK